jgi:hypothetical protein
MRSQELTSWQQFCIAAAREGLMNARLSTVLAIVLLATPAITSAQTAEFGIKGGLSFANVPELADFFEDAGADEVGYRTGVTFGGHLAFDLTDTMAIQPEVLFTQRGFSGEGPDDFDFGANLDYIDFPVLLRFGAGDSGLTVLAGPSFNFNIRAVGTAEDQDDEDIREDIETFDLGLVAGVGFYGRSLIVEGRFQEGLTNIATFEDADDDNRNRSFMMLVGVRFR